MGERQPQTGPFADPFGREKRFKDARQDLRGNPVAVVPDPEPDRDLPPPSVPETKVGRAIERLGDAVKDAILDRPGTGEENEFAAPEESRELGTYLPAWASPCWFSKAWTT